MEWIYGLAEPNGEIRYVGRTANLHERIVTHFGPSAELPVLQWVARVRRRGEDPLCVQLMLVPDDDAADWESFWICRMSITGRLLNRTLVPVGNGPNLFAEWMRVRGFTQCGAAAVFGVNQSTVSGWLTGRTLPRGDRIADLQRIAGIDPAAWQGTS